MSSAVKLLDKVVAAKERGDRVPEIDYSKTRFADVVNPYMADLELNRPRSVERGAVLAKHLCTTFSAGWDSAKRRAKRGVKAITIDLQAVDRTAEVCHLNPHTATWSECKTRRSTLEATRPAAFRAHLNEWSVDGQ